jgi:serine/threonine-protein kinase
MSETVPEPSTARWAQVRSLFDSICDLPETQQRARLAELGADPELAEEVMGLVAAQTAFFVRAVEPLQSLVAGLDREGLPVGARIGVWTISARLARGGMGSVYVAERHDALFRQKVAIKVLDSPRREGAAERFAAERALLAELVHPDIARLYDGGCTQDGLPFLVMEFIDGLPLDRFVRERGLGLEARLLLFERIAAAVSFAHQRLVIHCDLKPENVLVRADGSPALLDFGIARLADREGGGEGWCTPAYASPEQIAGKRLGTATDVFSLGVMLAELLVDGRYGRGPADAGSPLPAPSAVLAGASASAVAKGWRRALRGDLDAIVARATALDPAQRYASVAELLADLRRRREHRPVRARPATLPLRLGRFLRRQWRSAATAAALVAVVSGFSLQLVRERDRAREAAETAEATSRFLVDAFAAADPRRGAAVGQASARDVLDAGAARIDTELADRPAVRAQLLLSIGRAYFNLGQDAKAETLLTEAVALFLDPRVDRPLDAVEALEELSVLAGNGHRGDDAVAFAERADALRREAGDTSTVGRAEALNHLGIAYTVAGDLDRARAALVESLALRRTLDEPLALLATLNNLGRVERESGRLEEAESHYTEALRLTEVIGPRAGPSRQTALTGLSRIRMDRGQREAALPLLREALALAITLYGADGAAVSNAHNELASMLHDLGRLNEAEPHYRRALAIQAAIRGEESLGHAVALNNLALLLEDRGDHAGAEPLARRSLAIRQAELAADHPMVLRSQANLARLLVRAGRRDEAAELLGPVIAHHRERTAPERTERVRAELVQAEWLTAEGRFAEAEALLSAIQIPADPGRARDRQRREQLWIALREAQGRHDEALARAEALDAELAADPDASPLHRQHSAAEVLRLREAGRVRTVPVRGAE